MRKMFCLIMVFLFSLTLISACGPSEEAIATMTASAWTPTPKPTLTPTPLPFDLEVTLEDESGNPITVAYVEVKELETDASAVDDTGNVEFLNLPGGEVALVISAQGYDPVEETVALERGMNTKSYSMQVDPLQIQPSEACQEGQKVLYIEDFEDGFAQGWDGISRPRWEFEDVEGRGKVLTFMVENTEGAGTPIEGGKEFGNIVWKWDTFNDNDIFLNFHEKDEQRYLIRFQPGGEGVQIFHVKNGEHQASAYRGFNEKEWISVAIAFYDNSLEFWINDELYLALDDPDPIPSGGLMMHFTQPGAIASLDNMVICELTEPYAPPVTEENVD